MPFELHSPVLVNGFLPKRYATDGDDVSPPLEWSDIPQGTKSFVLIVNGADEQGELRTHWLVYGIPEDWQGIPEHLSPEERMAERDEAGRRLKQGQNDFGQVGYSGPPPRRDRPCDYAFVLYALDCDLRLPPATTREDVVGAMHGHVLEHAQLIARYSG